MRNIVLYLSPGLLALALVSCAGRSVSGARGRVVSVAQSGTADVVGNDSAALQKAAGCCSPAIRSPSARERTKWTTASSSPPASPSGACAGKTILRKSAAWRAALAEDGDYGESALIGRGAGQVPPGHGDHRSSTTLASGWDISVTGGDRRSEGNMAAHRPREPSATTRLEKSTRGCATPSPSSAP